MPTLKETAIGTTKNVLNGLDTAVNITAQVVPSAIAGTAKVLDSILLNINAVFEPTEEEKKQYNQNLVKFMSDCAEFNKLIANPTKNNND